MYCYTHWLQETTLMDTTHYKLPACRMSIHTNHIKQKTDISLKASRTSQITDGGWKDPS